MFNPILIFAILVTSLTLQAHDGHHHDSGTVAPPKGGVIKSLETVHVELLPHGKTVKIFVYDKDLKPVEAKNYPVSANAIRARKKAEKVELRTEKHHWEFEYDAKGAHRYLFQFTIEQGGHKDKIKWNIEPKN